MKKADYDDPKVEAKWCEKQRSVVAGYLQKEGVKHGRIGDWPAWHIAPCVAIWAVESHARPNWIGWWVITGDLPTDYISTKEVPPPQHPRRAVRAIAERWRKCAQAWNLGQDCAEFEIRGPHSHQELAPLLASRAEILIEWTNDDSFWTKDRPQTI